MFSSSIIDYSRSIIYFARRTTDDSRVMLQLVPYMFSRSIIDYSTSIRDYSRSILDESRSIIDDSRSIIDDSRVMLVL
jgi:hypothetical protein